MTFARDGSMRRRSVGDSAGIAGSASVFVMNTGSRAYVEDAPTADDAAEVRAGGVTIDAGGDLTITMVAGSIGAGSSVGGLVAPAFAPD